MPPGREPSTPAGARGEGHTTSSHQLQPKQVPGWARALCARIHRLFASKEGKKASEFYPPRSVVKILVEMVDPYQAFGVPAPATEGRIDHVTVNFVRLVAFPAGVLTMILPVVAPAGTVAVIFVAELTVNVAITPLNFTAVAPVKFVPEIVTEVPTGPEVGVKLVIVGEEGVDGPIGSGV